MPIMSLEGKIQLFSQVFVKEFTREFVFLADVAAGRTTRRNDFTDKLLRIFNSFERGIEAAIPILGPVSEVLGELGSVGAEIVSALTAVDGSRALPKLSSGLGIASSLLGAWKEREKAAGSQRIAKHHDLIDLKALRILLESVAREITYSYEFFLSMRLADEEDAVIAFAKGGVIRSLEYLARTGKEVTQENILQGLIEGRSGQFIEGWRNTPLSGKEGFTDLTVEGVYGRSAFCTDPGTVWLRHTAKHKEVCLALTSGKASSSSITSAKLRLALSSYGYVKYKDKATKNYPKYGYVHVPEFVVRSYDFKRFRNPFDVSSAAARNLSVEAWREFNTYPWRRVTISVADISAYLTQLREAASSDSTPIARLVDYIAAQERYRHAKVVVFRGDLSDIDLHGGDYSGVDFTGVKLSGDLSRTNFSKAILIGARLTNITSARDANFTEAHCEYLAVGEAVNLSGARLTQAYFQFAEMNDADLRDCETTGAHWYKAQLGRVTFSDATRVIHAQQEQITAIQLEIAREREALEEWQRVVSTTLNLMNQHILWQATQIDRHEERLCMLEAKASPPAEFMYPSGLVPSFKRSLEALARTDANRDSLKKAFTTLYQVEAVNRSKERIWDPILEKPIDVILEGHSMALSLFDDIKKFHDLWQRNTLLITDTDLLQDALCCYNKLINVELNRLIARLDLKTLQQNHQLLSELYHLGLMSWESIDSPYRVVIELLKIIEQTSDIYNFTRHETTTVLFCRVLRLYVDLEIQKQFEFGQSQATESTVRESPPAIVTYLGPMLYQTTGFQYGVFASKKAKALKYYPKHIVKWGEHIGKFKSDLEEAYGVIPDSIEHELEQAAEGIRCFPTTTDKLLAIIRGNFPIISRESPLSSVPGLLSMAYQAYQQLWGADYADLWEARAMIGIICFAATSEQQREASNLVKHLQKALTTAVKKGQRSLSYGLLNTLGFIASHAGLPRLRHQAFFGANDVTERAFLAVDDFISPFWSKHLTLNTLHYLAIEILKDIILNKRCDLPLLLESTEKYLETGKEHQALALLNLFNTEGMDTAYAETAKTILATYLTRHLDHLVSLLRVTESSHDEILSLCSRVQAVAICDPWQMWAAKAPTVTYELPGLLATFFESHAGSQPNSTKKAIYLALAILMHLLPKRGEERTQTQLLLSYTKAISDGNQYALAQLLQVILRHLFVARTVLAEDQQDKFKALLKPFAEALLTPEVYLQGSEFLYRYLPSAVFFSDPLRTFVQSMLYASELVRQRPSWHTNWDYSCSALVSFPVSGKAIPATRLDVRLEYCVNGEFKDQGPLSPAVFALLDSKGHLMSAYSTSKSIVNRLTEPRLHFKYYPDFPGNEFAARRLYGHLTGQWCMAKLAWFKTATERYPVLITETVEGDTLSALTAKNQDVEKQCQSKKDFNAENFRLSFSWQIIYALLARLGDAKPSNYILSPDGSLQPIDMEEFWCATFLEPEEVSLLEEAQTKKTTIRHRLGIKNILFCMPEMDSPVDEKVIEDFLSLSTEDVLQHFLSDMAEYNRHLHSEDIDRIQTEYRRLVLRAGGGKSLASILKFEFDSGNISQCYNHFLTLQRCFRKAKREGRSLSHRDLLNEIDPALGAIYKHVYEEHDSPILRFETLTKGLYDVYETKVEHLASPVPVEIRAESIDTTASVGDGKSLRTAALYIRLLEKRRGAVVSYLPYNRGVSDGCTELETSIAAGKALKKIMRSLATGDAALFDRYYQAHIIALLLQHLDLTSAQAKEPHFIATIARHLPSADKNLLGSIKKLHIIGACHLTDAQFDVLVSYLPNLSWVILEDCKQLGQNSIISLAKRCPQLSILDIRRLTKLETISSWMPGWSSYPSLAALTVTQCSSLKSIYIDAPKLRHLDLSDNLILINARTRSLSLRLLNIARTRGITTKTVNNIALEWKYLSQLDVSACAQVHLDQLIFWPTIKTKLRKLRIESCAINNYLYFLVHPEMAMLLSSRELVPYLHQLINSKLLVADHLPQDKSHWLIRLLSEIPDLQQQFLQYILSCHPADDDTQQKKVYQWLAMWIKAGLITRLDFTRVSCDYTSLPTIRLENESRTSLLVLPDGRLAASGIRTEGGSRSLIELLDPKTMKSTKTFGTTFGYINLLAVLPSGQLVSAQAESEPSTRRMWGTGSARKFIGNIKVWDVATGQCIAMLTVDSWRDTRVNALTVLPNGELAAGFNGYIKCWNIETQRCTRTIDLAMFSSGRNVTALAALQNGILASGHLDCILLWDTQTGKCMGMLPSDLPVDALTVLPNGLLANSSLDRVVLWDTDTMRCWTRLSAPDVWSPVIGYDVLSGGFAVDVYKSASDNGRLALLPNGLLVTGSGSYFQIWNTDSRKLIATLRKGMIERRFKAKIGSMAAVVTLPDGSIVTATTEGHICVWDFPRKVPKEYAQYLADALRSSSSVTLLAGAEFIEDDSLRELITSLVKRNARLLEDPDVTLAEETRPGNEAAAVEGDAGESSFNHVSSTHEDESSFEIFPEELLHWANSTSRIKWYESNGDMGGVPESKDSDEDYLSLMRDIDREFHLEAVASWFKRNPGLQEDFFAWRDSNMRIYRGCFSKAPIVRGGLTGVADLGVFSHPPTFAVGAGAVVELEPQI